MRPRRVLLVLAILGAVAAVLLLLRRPPVDVDVVDAGPSATVGAVDAGTAPLEIRVGKVDGGKAEVQRGKGGPWEPVATGATLRADDAIRAGPATAIEIEAGGHVVELAAGTDVRVAELTEGLTRYLLGSGFVAADAKGGKGKLQVEVEGTDVAVNATDGRFQMTSNGQGTVAVAAQRGDVRVAASGKEVVLQPGERTLVLPKQAPSAPVAVASSLLLKVSWPAERETNKRVVTIAGRTEAGALVFAMGRPMKVDADGRFSAKVNLAEGQTTLDLVARDASGNVVRQGGPRIVVDSRGAASKFETKDLWQQKETGGGR